MAIPTITLLQKKPLHLYECEMCGEVTRKNSYKWKSYFTGDEIVICRECAYKESFGAKKIKQAKKERILG
tara:strand:- start:30492 stop:30701 length:210 start_codon:yes stop_codon:yes gene_type:complete